MSTTNLTTYSPGNLDGKTSSNRVRLYERFGAMAYGVILQIIPEKEQAQRVLIDLFSSPQLETLHPETSQGVASSIIRQARSRALAARRTPSTANELFVSTTTAGNDKQAKYVFNLAFCQGITPETIAQRLQIPYSAVMQAIHDYFLFLRTSQLSKRP